MQRVCFLFGLVFELISPIEEGKMVLELTKPINSEDYERINCLLHRISSLCGCCDDGLYTIDVAGYNYAFWPDKKDPEVLFVSKQERLADVILGLIHKLDSGFCIKYCKQIKAMVFERSKYEGGKHLVQGSFVKMLLQKSLFS